MATIADTTLQFPGAMGPVDGPVTSARLTRNRMAHIGMCLIGMMPWLLSASPGLQAFGWGLWLPGLGFVSVGGWALLLVPVTFIFFSLAIVAWFGTGMVIAPIIVWAGATLLAAAMAGDAAANYTPVAVPAITIAYLGISAWRRSKTLKERLARRAVREATLPAIIREVRAAAVPAPSIAERELSEFELSMLRYVLDRALQPLGRLNGFNKIDQFQTSALRYQLNQIGWTIAIAQLHHTPNFHGYLNEAQRRVIEQYLQDEIWGYWRYENAWGNLNFDGDPAKKDNVMMTGYFPINILLYMLNTGDDRYSQAGSLTFQRRGKNVYPHDIHSIVQSLVDNFRGKYSQPFCLYPCEPNWIYPGCNFRGLTSVRIYDTYFGTDYFSSIADHFRQSFEHEFIRPDGGVVPLRSKLTGHELPFPAPDSVNVKELSPLFPDLSEKYWAITRGEDVYHENGKLKIKLPEKAVDFGNYSSGNMFVFDGLLSGSTEMGDRNVVEEVRRMILDSGSLIETGNVTNFDASNLANASIMQSWFNVTNGWRDAIQKKRPTSVLEGPILAEAQYPDVLVAQAISDGSDLQLVLYPGTASGAFPIGIERLRSGALYRVVETGEEVTADSEGKIVLNITLDGRTPLNIVPAQ
jgi:Linalool dehydratase/isomerase